MKRKSTKAKSANKTSASRASDPNKSFGRTSLFKRGKGLPTAGSRSRLIEEFDRVKTGVDGLDSILNGGFLKGGTYLLLGAPGTGKTIFANQVCFHQIKNGGRAVYVTLLAESHTRMFGNLKPMQFFDSSKVSTEIQYLSGYSILEKEGLDGLLRLLRDLVYQHGANILFIDGIASADELSGSTVQFKKFVHHLNSVIGIAGCTTFLLSSQVGDQTQPEYTMVDGIVELTFCRTNMKTARQIEVRKFRGSAHLYGQHFLEIDDQGLHVYPRIEALYGREREPIAMRGRCGFGVPDLDRMFDGGLARGSVTGLLGPVGCGKTQFGMNFLREGAKLGEASMLLSMYEHPERLAAKMSNLKQPIDSFIAKGTLTILRREAGEMLVDKTVSRLLKEVERHKIKRLFIDGIHGFKTNMLRAERLPEIITAAFHELRALGVTTLFVEETDILAAGASHALSNHSAITDNLISFRHASLDGRSISIVNFLKTRESSHSHEVRELLLEKTGIRVGSVVSFVSSELPVVRKVGDFEK